MGINLFTVIYLITFLAMAWTLTSIWLYICACFCLLELLDFQFALELDKFKQAFNKHK